MSTSVIIALRYLTARRLRTTLTTLAIVFGVAAIFGGNLALPSMFAAFSQKPAGAEADMTISAKAGAPFAPQAVLSAVTGVKGVAAASPTLRRQLPIPASLQIENAPQMQILGVDPASIQTVRRFDIKKGRFLQPGDRNALVLPSGAGAVGATVPLPTVNGVRPFTVVGVMGNLSSLTTPELVMTLADAQAVLGEPGLANGVEIALQPGADRAAVSAQVLQATGSAYQASAASDLAGLTSAFSLGSTIFNIFGLLALFVGGFLVYNTFRTIAIERRRDLAMLRAIGAQKGQITRLMVTESLIQGALGVLIGLALGYLLALLLLTFYNSFAPQFFAGVTAGLSFNGKALALAVGVGLLTTLAAGYFPARDAARVSPLAALRPATISEERGSTRRSVIVGGLLLAVALLAFLSPKTAALGAVLFMAALAVAAVALVNPAARLFDPFLRLWFASEGAVAQGNVRRQPGRAAITASTFMIGLAFMVLCAALISSLTLFMTDMITRNFASDMVLMPQSIVLSQNIGADPALAERLRAVPQVQTVSAIRSAPTTVGGESASVLGIDPATYRQVSALDFSAGSADEAFAALGSGRAVILNAILASGLGARPGDSVALQTPGGPQTYRVVGVANDILTMKLATAYTAQANLQTDFQKTDDVMLMLKLKPGASRAEARAAVQDIAADYPQFTTLVTADYRSQLLQDTLGKIGAIYIISLIILIPAVLGLLNTLAINVMERTREVGTLRAVGSTRAQIRRMIAAEALLLGLFGASIGVLAGVAMSYGFIIAFKGVIGWNIPYALPVMGVIATIVLGVLLALFASILPARNAAKLDIIEALRYE